MKYLLRSIFILLLFFVFSMPAFAVEIAPRISDREIIESLAELKAGQKAINQRFNGINQRFNGINQRFDGINQRFDGQQNIMLFLATVFIGILGYLIKMQRQTDQRQTRIETSLETQKDEIAWLKEMINKLLVSKGVL